jgi:hypothetical protein
MIHGQELINNSPRFMEKYPLLVIFHDPPNVISRADPVTGSAELHNIWLVSTYSLVLSIR